MLQLKSCFGLHIHEYMFMHGLCAEDENDLIIKFL